MLRILEPNDRQVATDVRARREELGLERRHLAALAGVSETAVERLEYGAEPIDRRALGRVARALRLTYVVPGSPELFVGWRVWDDN